MSIDSGSILNFLSNAVFSSALLSSGFLMGLLVEVIVQKYIAKIALKSEQKFDDILISSVKSIPLITFLLGSIYLTTYIVDFRADFVDLLRKSIVVLFLITFTWWGLRFSGDLVHLYTEKKKGYLPATTIFANLVKGLVFVIGVLMILSAIGVSIMPMLTALGVGGLAIALALKDTLTNLFAGVYLLISRKIKLGDFIEVEKNRGTVNDITWRDTTIKNVKNNLIIIPNSIVASAVVTNYSKPKSEARVWIEFGVAYNSDLEKVEKVVLRVAESFLSIKKEGLEFKPKLRFNKFGEYNIQGTVIMKTIDDLNVFDTRTKFIKALHKEFKKEKIEIPFPTRSVYMKSK